MVNYKMEKDFWKNVYEEGLLDISTEQLPWNIGEPQPEIAAIAPQLQDPILDAGCGVGVTSCYLASLGKNPVVGIDIAPAAISLAQQASQKLQVADKVTFQADDITNFSGYDNYFQSIIDCTLFHSLPLAARESYQKSMLRVARSGGKYVVLVFSHDAWTTSEEGQGPLGVTREELIKELEPYWVVDDVSPAFIHIRPDGLVPTDSPVQPVISKYDSQNRPMLSAWLAQAHKA